MNAIYWTPEKLRELEAEILAWRPPSVTSVLCGGESQSVTLTLTDLPEILPNRLHGAYINEDGDAV